MQSLLKNHTWTLIEKPLNKIVVGCKWVYKVKEGIPEVELKRYKVRLVAKGFTQKESIDYTEIAFPCSETYLFKDLVGTCCDK